MRVTAGGLVFGVIAMTISALCLVLLRMSPSPSDAGSETQAPSVDAGRKSATTATTPEGPARVSLQYPIEGGNGAAEVQISQPRTPSDQDVSRDLRGTPLDGAIPQAPIHYLVPSTSEERAWFVESIMGKLTVELPVLCFGKLRGRYAQQIRPGLTKEDSASALALVERLTDAEFRHRTEIDKALRHYVMNAPDLGSSAHPLSALGRTGAVGGAVSPADRVFGGVTSPIQVRVRYFLDYASYPELRATGLELQSLKREFREYQVLSGNRGPR